MRKLKMDKPKSDVFEEKAKEIAERTGQAAFVLGKYGERMAAVPSDGNHGEMAIYQCVWPENWRYKR